MKEKVNIIWTTISLPVFFIVSFLIQSLTKFKNLYVMIYRIYSTTCRNSQVFTEKSSSKESLVKDLKFQIIFKEL